MEQRQRVERAWGKGEGVGWVKKLKKNGAGFARGPLTSFLHVCMCVWAGGGVVVRTLALIKCYYGAPYMSAGVKNDVHRVVIVCLSFSPTRHAQPPQPETT